MTDLHPVVVASLLELEQKFQQHHRNDIDSNMHKEWKKFILQFKEK